ncbi:MAG: WG repeat-containing protein, partial [Paludibacteraceae bacterium]|nr:WG repeat-containing protein [Paludibacteraceae bacterium]
MSSQNSTKISNSYDFFTKNGDTILYRSEFFCSESDVDWLMNKRTRLYALVDSNFNVLTDFKYDSFYPIYGNTAIVRRNGNWGLINKRGEELIDFIYPN